MEYEQLGLWHKQADNARSQLVVKSNTLIQKSRYSLSVQEQKILLYIISKIKPADSKFIEYEFDMRDMCHICGIELNGKNYLNLRDSIKSLHDKSFWVETPDKHILISWLERVEIDKNLTTIRLQLDDRLMPYLLELRECFTSYELVYTLMMKSKYSIRMYELLKSYISMGHFYIGINELKELLLIEGYKEYKEFKRNVIDRAVKEINQYTDIFVEYTAVRSGKTIEKIMFSIFRKTEAERDTVKSLNNYMLNEGL